MKSSITIGRSSHCDIIISNENVSREHARISIVGGTYVYEDLGKNGSVIGGRVVKGQRLAVAAGADILLAGKVPLPWAQIYAMLPLKGVRPYDTDTYCEPTPIQGGSAYVKEDSLGIGWGIFAFLIPLAGWIMYFVWKDETPRRASQACTVAWVGFVLNIISTLAAM